MKKHTDANDVEQIYVSWGRRAEIYIDQTVSFYKKNKVKKISLKIYDNIAHGSVRNCKRKMVFFVYFMWFPKLSLKI